MKVKAILELDLGSYDELPAEKNDLASWEESIFQSDDVLQDCDLKEIVIE